ncbi:hypothetical protein GUJ93_ZPchr0009g2132 [Zizania palustris]|uniref:Uncharacterized protein n=1 Tax=Zizania palustris TaxID=103762 RepID=A0A8J5RKX2_ZIZPA|nr:hypothetical protein GUJ93_ZPchr0009g2132 [Zizania palustris]
MKRSNAMSSTAACSSSQPILSGDVIIIDDIPEPPSSKRKLNFGNEPDGACDILPSTLSALVDNAPSDEGLAQDFQDIAANQGLDSIIDIPTNDFYIAGPADDFPQPLPSAICEVSSMFYPLDMLSSPAYQVNSHDTSDIMVKSTSEAKLGMDFIEKAFQEATIKVLMGAIEGLNTDTLRDPQCCARLEDEERAQFAHKPSEREANGKKWNEAIVEAATGVEQVASNLQVKITSCYLNSYVSENPMRTMKAPEWKAILMLLS